MIHATPLRLPIAIIMVMASFGSAVTAQSPADDRAHIIGLIDKAIKAMGGQDQVSKLQAVSWQAKFEQRVGGKIYTAVHEASAQGWDKYRLDAELKGGSASRKLLVIINGDKAWAQENMGKVDDLPKEMLSIWKDGLYPVRLSQLLPDLKNKAFIMFPLGELKISDKDAVGIQVSRQNHRDVSLFFDKATGLPAKSETRLTLPSNREITLELLFSAYKDFDGLKHFSRIAVKADGKEFVIEVTELRGQENLDESLFAKP